MRRRDKNRLGGGGGNDTAPCRLCTRGVPHPLTPLPASRSPPPPPPPVRAATTRAQYYRESAERAHAAPNSKQVVRARNSVRGGDPTNRTRPPPPPGTAADRRRSSRIYGGGGGVVVIRTKQRTRARENTLPGAAALTDFGTDFKVLLGRLGLTFRVVSTRKILKKIFELLAEHVSGAPQEKAIASGPLCYCSTQGRTDGYRGH